MTVYPFQSSHFTMNKFWRFILTNRRFCTCTPIPYTVTYIIYYTKICKYLLTRTYAKLSFPATAICWSKGCNCNRLGATAVFVWNTWDSNLALTALRCSSTASSLILAFLKNEIKIYIEKCLYHVLPCKSPISFIIYRTFSVRCDSFFLIWSGKSFGGPFDEFRTNQRFATQLTFVFGFLVDCRPVDVSGSIWYCRPVKTFVTVINRLWRLCYLRSHKTVFLVKKSNRFFFIIWNVRRRRVEILL